MTRRAPHPLGTMPPGAQLVGITGLALLGRSVILSEQATAKDRS